VTEADEKIHESFLLLQVLVVSYNGKSRAPALVVQYLMQYFRISLERAMNHVRTRHPPTRVNPGFARALQRLQKRMNEEDALAASCASSEAEPPPPFPDDAEGDGGVSGSLVVAIPSSSHNMSVHDSPGSAKGRKTAWDEC
jgi:hypothetical protein